MLPYFSMIFAYLFGVWLTIGIANYISGRWGRHDDFYQSAPRGTLMFFWPVYWACLVVYFAFTNKVTYFVFEQFFSFGDNMKRLGTAKRNFKDY